MRVCLWFDDEAEEAVRYYTTIFADSEMGSMTYFGTEGFEHHGKAAGTVLAVDFRLNQMLFTAINGGPRFSFNEAISLIVECETQQEIDDYWAKLSAGGEEAPCGWLKDRYGVSWQIQPRGLRDWLCTADPQQRARIEKVLYTMKKLDIESLMKAYDGTD